ncbi:GlcG/HbpS family heme-binding protein [Brevundimonas sp. BH3]|uniref:GlcG/HbpS family heme-binding protein n=1 Tax=Brevundimonas sp. BH3 TaxID=3133089 RepID=UPI003877B3F8
MIASISLLATLALSYVTLPDNQPVAPQGVLFRQDVSLDLANRLASSAVEICHAQGRSAVVAVVDRSGNLVALQRDDVVGPHNTAAAQRKAYTALSTKTPTRIIAERARNDPASENLNTLDELLLLGGGVPLIVNGQIIGALGVAGAGGAEADEGCALASINLHLPQD